VKSLDFYQRMKSAITRGEHLNGAFRLLRGNGQEAWLRSILQPVKNSEGRIKYFTLHSSDLTRTIETSREHESLIKALMRSTAVIEFDLDGIISPPTTVPGHRRLSPGADSRQAPPHVLRAGRGQLGRLPSVLGQAAPWRICCRALQAHRCPWPGDLAGGLVQPDLRCPRRAVQGGQVRHVITDQVNQELAVAEAADVAYNTSLGTDVSARKATEVVTQTVT
jgi:methyl-accepting chemotaxis protein